MAARPRTTRQFWVLWRARRHELLAATFQDTLAATDSAEPGSREPVEAGGVALTTLVQAYGNGGEREAVELTGLDKRWPLVLDGLGAEGPPCSQGPLLNCRMRLMAHNLAKALLERTVALAEPTGGFGARPRRAALACRGAARAVWRPRGPCSGMPGTKRWAALRRPWARRPRPFGRQRAWAWGARAAARRPWPSTGGSRRLGSRRCAWGGRRSTDGKDGRQSAGAGAGQSGAGHTPGAARPGPPARPARPARGGVLPEN